MGYDGRTDFRKFVFERASKFEMAVVQHLRSRFTAIRIAADSKDTQRREAVEATWHAMRGGAEVIEQGVLWNPETQTYGAPDLLVRSDVLRGLFPNCLSEEASVEAAPDLGLSNAHYRVVDIKFTTLHLLKDGQPSGALLEYAVQVWLYNDALARMQGVPGTSAFLLGRRWKDAKGRGGSALERLARIDSEALCRGTNLTLREFALNACDWVRRVRRIGAQWDVLPEPSVFELRPNMRHADDQPWHQTKAEIARALEDLTLLPRVTPDGRARALAAGVSRWTDSRCTAALFGIKGDTHPRTVDAVIRVNHCSESVVQPSRITANESLWRVPVRPEFYVDFETVSDLDDDFARFPETGGQPLIFMIGCGELMGDGDDVEWKHHVFIADRLTLAEERRIIEEWLEHVKRACAVACVPIQRARLFHWSPAEISFLTDAYNAAVVRHQAAQWPTLPWVDLLSRVVRRQPVTVRGAFGFGLKAIAKALHRHGLIQTVWGDGPTDGLGAMVGAWWCDREAHDRNVSMCDLDLMKEIEYYNEIDCRVMAEVLQHFRRNC